MSQSRILKVGMMTICHQSNQVFFPLEHSEKGEKKSVVMEHKAIGKMQQGPL